MDTNEIEAAAHEIAAKLFESEIMIESGLANVAALVAAMPRLKLAAGLTVLHAQDVLEQASDLMALLTQARRKAGDLHRKLETTQRLIGVDVVAFGWVGKPPADATPLPPLLREVCQVA